MKKRINQPPSANSGEHSLQIYPTNSLYNAAGGYSQYRLMRMNEIDQTSAQQHQRMGRNPYAHKYEPNQNHYNRAINTQGEITSNADNAYHQYAYKQQNNQVGYEVKYGEYQGPDSTNRENRHHHQANVNLESLKIKQESINKMQDELKKLQDQSICFGSNEENKSNKSTTKRPHEDDDEEDECGESEDDDEMKNQEQTNADKNSKMTIDLKQNQCAPKTSRANQNKPETKKIINQTGSKKLKNQAAGVEHSKEELEKEKENEEENQTPRKPLRSQRSNKMVPLP